MRPAPETFTRRTDADVWLAREQVNIVNGDWINPDAGLIPLGHYAERWVRERANLRPKTMQLYEGLVRRHISPSLAAVPIADLTPARIRTWRSSLIERGLSPTTTAKAYRLLKTIMQTAVDDQLIRNNPCRIKGASVERPAERPTISIDQVFAVADGMPPRYRALVLLATFASMRFGELAALERQRVDLDAGFIDIRQSVVEMGNGRLIVGPPKTAAGRRVVAVPSDVLPDIRHHLDTYVGSSATALVFAGPQGAPLRRSNFQKHWRQGLDAAGITDLHFHDLRHTGNTLAAQSGATLSDLMARMGHASTRAAQIYLHTTSQRDRVVADALNSLLSARSGTDVARHAAARRPEHTLITPRNAEGPGSRGLQL